MSSEPWLSQSGSKSASLSVLVSSNIIKTTNMCKISAAQWGDDNWSVNRFVTELNNKVIYCQEKIHKEIQ